MALKKLKAALLMGVSGAALGAWAPPVERAAFRARQQPIVHEPIEGVVSSAALISERGAA